MSLKNGWVDTKKIFIYQMDYLSFPMFPPEPYLHKFLMSWFLTFHGYRRDTNIINFYINFTTKKHTHSRN